MIPPRLVHLQFGKGGSALPHLLAGWAAPEPGFCWTLNTGAALRLTLPPGDGDAFLELALNPHVAPQTGHRRLEIRVNDVMVGEDWLQGEGELAYALPSRALPPDGALTIKLLHDPAPSPADLCLSADNRPLGFMLHTLRLLRVPPKPRADVTVLRPIHVSGSLDIRERILHEKTGLSARALLENFESLGHNCEFGLLQRHLGAEPLDLLRFAGLSLNDLLAALRDDFARIGENLALIAHPTDDGRREYIIRDEHYRIGFHSFFTTDQASAEEVREKHLLRLKTTRRFLLERLQSGERICVFQRPGQIARGHALVLLNLLQARGPNALLYVDQDPRMPSGTVEQVGHGLFHGKLDRMAPARDAGNVDILGWLSTCANAYILWQKMRAKNVV